MKSTPSAPGFFGWASLDRMRKSKSRFSRYATRALRTCSNMFDLPYVQRLAFDRNYYDLVLFIEEHRDEYVHFILHGDVR